MNISNTKSPNINAKKFENDNEAELDLLSGALVGKIAKLEEIFELTTSSIQSTK